MRKQAIKEQLKGRNNMKTTVIPAQVTTVEDTITGNFNLTQIVLLVSSLFVNTFIYSFLPKQMAFSPYKVILMIIVFVVFITLSLRIKNRIILQWLTILVSYAFRPHLYFFDKNVSFGRLIPEEKRIEKSKKSILTKPSKLKTIPPQFDQQTVLRNKAISIHFNKNRILVSEKS